MEHRSSLETLSNRGEQNLDIKSALHTIESYQARHKPVDDKLASIVRPNNRSSP